MWLSLFIALLAPTTATAPATTQAASIDGVETLLAAGQREQAIAQFTRLADPGKSGRAIELRVKINRAADELLDQAEELLQAKDYAAATERLSGLLTTMAGLPTASLARQRLAELCARPEVQDQLHRKETDSRGAAALAEARRLRDEGQEDEAYAAFKQVATDFAETLAGRAAAESVQAYEADPAFLKRFRDRAAAPQARAALSLAENYISAGRVDLARLKYEEVIKLFPGSSFAQTAQQKLDALK